MTGPKEYKITITEMGTETRTAGKEWKEGVDAEGKYGYTPEIEKILPYEKTIFEQTVKTLDLSAVVSVVNGIGGDK